MAGLSFFCVDRRLHLHRNLRIRPIQRAGKANRSEDRHPSHVSCVHPISRDDAEGEPSTGRDGFLPRLFHYGRNFYTGVDPLCDCKSRWAVHIRPRVLRLGVLDGRFTGMAADSGEQAHSLEVSMDTLPGLPHLARRAVLDDPGRLRLCLAAYLRYPRSVHHPT